MCGELRSSDVRYWHEADIKLRPLFGRYGVESGHIVLIPSFSAFDPQRTWLTSEKPDNLAYAKYSRTFASNARGL